MNSMIRGFVHSVAWLRGKGLMETVAVHRGTVGSKLFRGVGICVEELKGQRFASLGIPALGVGNEETLIAGKTINYWGVFTFE